MTYSWKKLMQNHPHDSICGCSVDEVNEEMKTRFAKSRQVADAIYEESVEYLTNKVNTAHFRGTARNPVCGMEYIGSGENTGGGERNSPVPGLQSVCVGWL